MLGFAWRSARRAPAMHWTPDRYPPPLENLPPGVRRKAIERANTLLSSGQDEDAALCQAIADARRWAREELCGLGSR